MRKTIPVLISLLCSAVLFTACQHPDPSVEGRLQDRYGWNGALPKPAADAEAGKEAAPDVSVQTAEKKTETGIVSTVDPSETVSPAQPENDGKDSVTSPSNPPDEPKNVPSGKKSLTKDDLSGETKDYVVKADESLWLLAVREYGDGWKWIWIHDANKDVLKDNPNYVRPGTKLRIPLLKKQAAAPEAGEKVPGK